MAYVTAAGSAGPLERNTPSGFMASTAEAGVCAGTTVVCMPQSRRLRRMFHLMPKSYATIRNSTGGNGSGTPQPDVSEPSGSQT